MINITSIAKELSIPEDELIKESLKKYLQDKLLEIESEIFRIKKRFSVENIYELDKKAKEGEIIEEEAFEDYFLLDNLEAEKEKIEKLLEKLNG
ncbi:hypothetical protein [Persephonella sp. KM09-Lau-8]|uniref:hypothetical protein n=1 Tax=Persephonella sp. KM09-Lau-8 TaxID=1158345 RepID=UPI0004955622|nr:hypothetical protein [Persephonella sp. KM09-Lau-8]